ncbi:MAG: hypothetical protein U0Q18_30610 [Bryobacteraceae bacterium]
MRRLSRGSVFDWGLRYWADVFNTQLLSPLPPALSPWHRWKTRFLWPASQVELLYRATGKTTLRSVPAMVALPGTSSSILVSTSDHRLTVFDDDAARAVTATADVRSLYVRPSLPSLNATGRSSR